MYNQKTQDIRDKKILFITTKNVDYIRNVQEINLFRDNHNEINLIASESRHYIVRLIYVYVRLLFLRVKPYDLVFIGFAPQLILPFWYIKFCKKRIVIDFFISIYDTLVFDRKKIRQGGVLAKLLRGIDSFTIQCADYVITDTLAHGKYFIEEFGLRNERLEVMYLEANQEIYYPRIAKKPEALRDKFVVLYFGTILPLQGVNIILDTMDKLKEVQDYYFQVIGPIGNKMKKPVADNIEYIDWVNQDVLADYIANADLCLAGHFASDIDKAKRTIPGKAYIFDWMKKDMILGDNEANRERFHQRQANIRFVKMGSSEALKKMIMEFAQVWLDKRKCLEYDALSREEA